MSSRRAFTLIELLVVIAIIALLLGILLPSLAGARKAARRTICITNIRNLSIAAEGYKTEFKDAIGSYSWEPRRAYSRFPDLNNAPDYPEAAMNQAVDILRRLAGRLDIPRLTDRIPHRHYSHLIFNDYMNYRLPEKAMACPEDRILLDWQANHRNPSPIPPGSPAWQKMWPFSTTYQIVPVAWAEDKIRGGRSTVEQYFNDHNLFWMGSLPLGRRTMNSVNFPSSKVFWFEFHDRHSAKRDLFYAYDNAAATQVFFDGSASANVSKDCNKGFTPNVPQSRSFTTMEYAPGILGFEPPTQTGRPTDIVTGYYRWTRGGLRGIDYGAREIDTGQIR
ncbi:MAG: prepilin-type N-terminal cleavage/methylation domain-containing protein [Phycisphaerales bacterium]|nr:prepilin-type N-terminal cleavage/methylation domain-containing protein [Phycisphaerales bacterium]